MISFAGRARSFLTITLSLTSPLVATAADITISTSRTTPIETSNADSGNAANVQISSSGSVKTSTGPSVTLNSNNSFINLGTVEVTSDTNAVAVRVDGGITGSFSNQGTIDAIVLDADDVASGSGNIAVWVTGSGDFVGDLSFEDGSSAAAGGTNAIALSIETEIAGDIYVNGALSAVGTNVTAVNIRSAIDGNITIDESGATYASGEGARGAFFDAPLSGTLSVTGTMTTTGIQANVDYDPDDDGVYTYTMAEFGIGIGASLGAGLQTADDGNISNGYTYTGILISPSIATTPSNITLGMVDATDAPYGFVNAGSISTTLGIANSAITAIRVEGYTTGGIFETFIEGGISNSGSIAATKTNDGMATAISFGAYASTPAIISSGTISASTYGPETATAYALLIESGASVPVFENSGTLTATANGDDAYAYGVVDLSGTLLTVTNSGTMKATATTTADVDDPGDDDVDGDIGDGASVVIVLDLSHAQGATTITNTGTITGNTLLSDQNDTVVLADDGDGADTTWSAWNGSIDFAGGDDTFTLSGAGVFTGSIIKTTGTLAIDVQDATLALGREDYIAATTIDFGAESRLTLEITPSNSSTPRLTAGDRITFADGAQITATMVEFGGVDLTSVLARAPLIDVSAMSSLVVQDIPYLYVGETTLVDGAVEDELLLTMHLKSSADLGFTGNNAAFYDAVIDILSVTDNSLAEPLLALSEEGEFMSAYRDLMPATSAPVLRGAIAVTDTIERAHGDRTAALLTGDTLLTGFNGWWSGSAQQISVDNTNESAGIDGDLTSVSFGAEGMLTPYGVIGGSVSFGSSSMFEDGSSTDRTRIDSSHAAVYAALSAGPVFASGSIGIGQLANRSKRTFTTDAYALNIEDEWDANTTDASVQGGLNVQLAKIIFRPWAGVSWLNVKEDAHSEDSGLTGFDLAYDETDIDVKRAKAGLSILFAGGDKHGRFLPELRASYSRLLSDSPTTMSASFVDGTTPFTLSTIPLAEEELSAGFGLSIVTEGVVFGINYDATLGDGELTHGGKLNVGMQF